MDAFSVNRQELATGVVRLQLIGEVDIAVTAALTAAQRWEIGDPTVAGLVVDLQRVTFLDSTGVAALVAGLRAARKRGIPFVVTNPHGMVRSVLEVTGVLGLLTGPDMTASGSTAAGESSSAAGH